MVVEPEPENIPELPGAAARQIQLEFEHYDAMCKAQRARYYAHLRQNEGFSKEELETLDRHPLSDLPRISRQLLVERLKNAKSSPVSEGEESEGPPWVPRVAPSDPVEQPWRDHEQERLAEVAKNPSLSRRTREKARHEWIKGQGGSARRVPRSRV